MISVDKLDFGPIGYLFSPAEQIGFYAARVSHHSGSLYQLRRSKAGTTMPGARLLRIRRNRPERSEEQLHDMTKKLVEKLNNTLKSEDPALAEEFLLFLGWKGGTTSREVQLAVLEQKMAKFNWEPREQNPK